MVDRDRSLCRILEVDLDDDLELAPAGLGDLVGRLGDSSVVSLLWRHLVTLESLAQTGRLSGFQLVLQMRRNLQ